LRVDIRVNETVQRGDPFQNPRHIFRHNGRDQNFWRGRTGGVRFAEQPAANNISSSSAPDAATVSNRWWVMELVILIIEPETIFLKKATNSSLLYVK